MCRRTRGSLRTRPAPRSCEYDAEAIARALEAGLASHERWRERRERALAYARGFDWPVLLEDALEKLGVRVD